MKRILFAATMLAASVFAPQASRADEVSVDFFYNNLSGGSWLEVGDYGYVWQPDVAVSDSAWRPYADGYWAYTDVGWTWVSYEDFGWATYHYGRWARLADYGWVWVPGRDEDLEWGPAWVSWRYGDEYVGWAPLPPETIGVVYAGRPVTGDIDIEFNIGPAYYNFVDVRYIGEPVLRERIVDYRQNVTYINQTVNITNITYNNKVVINNGPDVTVINARAARPVQRLKIERQENVDVASAAKSGGLVKPQGDKLMVAAPMHIRKAEKQVAPPQVKTKVAKANLDRGWSVVGDDNAQKQFKEQLKQRQSHKEEILSRAKAAPAGGAGAQAGASAGASTNALTGASAAPFEKGKGRGRDRGADKFEKQNARAGANANPDVNAGASASPAISGAPNEQGFGGGRGRHKGRAAEQQFNGNNPPTSGAETNPSANVGAAAGAGASASAAPEDQTRGGGKHGRRFEEQNAQGQQFNQTNPNTNVNPNAGADQNERRARGRRFDQPQGAQGQPSGQPTESTGAAGQDDRVHRGRRFDQPPGAQGQPSGQPNENAAAAGQDDRMRRGRRFEQQPAAQGPQGPQGAQGNTPNEFQPRHHGGEGEGQGQQLGPQGQGPQGQDQGQGPRGGRGRNKPEASPSVSPQ